jgi:hypothetical protein
MTPRQTIRTLGVLTFGALLAVGCKGVDKTKRGQRTVKANIGAFDASADMDLQLDGGGGGEMPDDYDVRNAFNSSFDGMDACVADYKSRKKIPVEKTLEGAIALSVKLNPKDSHPLGINASIGGHHGKDEQLKTCIKESVDKAPFPTYDGVPRVVDFETELDPGSQWVEE